MKSIGEGVQKEEYKRKGGVQEKEGDKYKRRIIYRRRNAMMSRPTGGGVVAGRGG